VGRHPVAVKRYDTKRGKKKTGQATENPFAKCYAAAYVTQYDLEMTLLSIRYDCR